MEEAHPEGGAKICAVFNPFRVGDPFYCFPGYRFATPGYMLKRLRRRPPDPPVWKSCQLPDARIVTSSDAAGVRQRQETETPAPTGRPTTAQGNALGTRPEGIFSSPERAAQPRPSPLSRTPDPPFQGSCSIRGPIPGALPRAGLDRPVGAWRRLLEAMGSCPYILHLADTPRLPRENVQPEGTGLLPHRIQIRPHHHPP